MTTPMILAVIVFAVFLAYAVIYPLLANLNRFIRRTRLFCPVHQEFGLMRLNVFEAALSSGYGPPRVHVNTCTLRPSGETCDEGCLKDAEF